MLKIEKKVNLAPYTTLGVGARADFFAVVKSAADVREAVLWARARQKEIYIIGGGSNLLISRPVKALVLKNEIRGVEAKEARGGSVLVSAGSGESWSAFVDYTVSQGWHGLENLSLIYGTVGAAPVQNIGAYGVELKDVFFQLSAVSLKSGRTKIFRPAECRFGYRESVFKSRYRGRYFITSVTVKLKKEAPLHLAYGAIQSVLEGKGISRPSLRDVAAAVKEIRASKLPDPQLLPNAGSFFKNIELSPPAYRRLAAKHPGMPSFPAAGGRVKVPAGWLIEQAGYKGRRLGSVGMHERQALVLINYGGARAAEVIRYARRVKAAVKRRFGLDLTEEINII